MQQLFVLPVKGLGSPLTKSLFTGETIGEQLQPANVQ